MHLFDATSVWRLLRDFLPVHADQDTPYREGIQCGSIKKRCE